MTIAILENDPADLSALDKTLSTMYANVSPVYASSWGELLGSREFPVDAVVFGSGSGRRSAIASRVRTCRASGVQALVLAGSRDDDEITGAVAAGATVSDDMAGSLGALCPALVPRASVG